MSRGVSILAALGLVVIGWVGIVITALPIFGISIASWGVWRLWPLSIIAIGLGLVLTPLFNYRRRRLGGMFIPGMPVLMTGNLLLIANMLDNWSLWEWAWPLIPFALAAGFFFAGLQLRVSGLLFPTIIVGLTSLAFLFTAITGLWEAWAVLWMIIPFSVGLALMTYKRSTRSKGVLLCTLSVVGLMGMTILLSGWWIMSLLISVGLVLTGASVLAWQTRHYLPSVRRMLLWADSVSVSQNIQQ